MPVPSTFNEEFLQWFRAKTEMSWRQLPPRRVEDFLAELKQEEEETGLGSAYRSDGGWHPAWRCAKWLNSLTDEEINTIEEQWHLRFPPDYRLFYKMLHATDRPRFVLLNDEFNWTNAGLFYNWQKAPTSIQWAYEHILRGFAFYDAAEANIIALVLYAEGPKNLPHRCVRFFGPRFDRRSLPLVKLG